MAHKKGHDGPLPPRPGTIRVKKTQHERKAKVLNFVDAQKEIQDVADDWVMTCFKKIGDKRICAQHMEALADFEKTLPYKRLHTIVSQLVKKDKGDHRHPTGVYAAEYRPGKITVSDGKEEAFIKKGKVECESPVVVSRDCFGNKDCEWEKQDKTQFHVMTGWGTHKGNNPKGVWDAVSVKSIPNDFLLSVHDSVAFMGLLKHPIGRKDFGKGLENGAKFYRISNAKRGNNDPKAVNKGRFIRHGEFAGSVIVKGRITPKMDGIECCLIGDGNTLTFMLRNGAIYQSKSRKRMRVGFEKIGNTLYLTWCKNFMIPNEFGIEFNDMVAKLINKIELEGDLYQVKTVPDWDPDMPVDEIPHDGIVVTPAGTIDQYFYKYENTIDVDKKTMHLVREYIETADGRNLGYKLDEVPGPGIWEFSISPDSIRLTKPRPDKKRPNTFENVMKAITSITVDEYLATHIDIDGEPTIAFPQPSRVGESREEAYKQW